MKIMSQDRKRFYEVTHSSCTCPDFVYRQAKQGGKCKHMIKCFFQRTSTITLRTDIKEWFRNGANIEDSCEKFGDKLIKQWLDIGEICEHILDGKKVYYLLE